MMNDNRDLAKPFVVEEVVDGRIKPSLYKQVDVKYTTYEDLTVGVCT